MVEHTESPTQKRRRRLKYRSTALECLECRTLLADGISPSPVPDLQAVVGVPLANAVFATYTVTAISGEPGTQWRGLINFGDGQDDGPLIPTEKGTEFEFMDTHTYESPGTYTVTVMIAVPGSMKANDNTVTTEVKVTGSSPSPTPTPTPTPSPHLVAKGLRLYAHEDQTFVGAVADVKDPGGAVSGFQATIDWGDGSPPASGEIERRGRAEFAVVGTHDYVEPGVFRVVVTIQNSTGQDVTARSSVRVKAQRKYSATGTVVVDTTS